MSDRTTTAVTAGQQLALDQLRQITGSARGGVFLAHVDTAPAKAPTGFVEARISVGCAGLSRAEGGLRLRSEEPVTLYIPPDFPFEVPLVYTRHSRFAGAPHVVWAHFPCLYRSTATEWDPADGMYGFITRLLDWFRAAAAQNDPVAQCYLGFCYLSGHGVPQEFGEAAKWFREAAEQDDPAAQFNLGVMYANGVGVPQDYVKSHFYTNLAAARLPPVQDRDIAVKNR